MQPIQSNQFVHLASYHFQTWRVVIDPSKFDVADLFRPQVWVNAIKFRVDDRIRVIATDKSFDFELTVTGKPEIGGGLVVDVWPRFPKGVMTEAAELADAADAVKRELIASTINGKPVPRVEETKADGWRVIDINGDVASKNHRSESAANVAMSKMLAQLGIDKVTAEKAKPAAGKAAA